LAPQFTEADFFLRYLAQEANVGVSILPDASSPLSPDKINMLAVGDAFAGADIFAGELARPASPVAGCVTWAPKTTETVASSGGLARLLVSNTNLLIIADVLLVHKGLAKERPDIVEGLVHGILEGNRLLRDDPATAIPTVAKAFKWDERRCQQELAKVHLANLPENQAFFAGSIESAGSFGGIYQSSVLAYGSGLVKNPVDADYFRSPAALESLAKKGLYAAETVGIRPIASQTVGPVERDPLLSKNIRFLFQPNSSKLDLNDPGNLASLADLKRMLQISPGSTILLRGHVDDSLKNEFKKEGGETFVRQMALKAMELSKDRAKEIKNILVSREKVPADRLEVVGRGWEEPVSKDREQNRRVEAQWFTLE